MTGEEFREIRLRLRLSQSAIAEVLGYRSSLTVSGYERQLRRRGVPHRVALLMKAFDAGYRPDNWPVYTRRIPSSRAA
jgi:transcriptional regulator with XRE-family HTH domain